MPHGKGVVLSCQEYPSISFDVQNNLQFSFHLIFLIWISIYSIQHSRNTLIARYKCTCCFNFLKLIFSSFDTFLIFPLRNTKCVGWFGRSVGSLLRVLRPLQPWLRVKPRPSRASTWRGQSAFGNVRIKLTVCLVRGQSSSSHWEMFLPLMRAKSYLAINIVMFEKTKILTLELLFWSSWTFLCSHWLYWSSSLHSRALLYQNSAQEPDNGGVSLVQSHLLNLIPGEVSHPAPLAIGVLVKQSLCECFVGIHQKPFTLCCHLFCCHLKVKYFDALSLFNLKILVGQNPK